MSDIIHRPNGLARRQFVTLAGLTLPTLLTGCGGEPAQQNLADLPPTRATGATAEAEAKLPPTALTLLMVTAPDCPICWDWRDKYQAAFEASPARGQMRFVTLHSYTIRQGSGQDTTWPKEWRWARDAARVDGRADHLPMTRYTPLYVLVRRDQYLLGANGTRGWRDKVWPMIQRETGTA